MLPHCRCRRKELEEKLGVIASIISRSPIWTSTLDIKLNKLFSCGLTDAEIGRRMGRSTSSILHRRISLGIYRVGPLKEKPVDWTHDEIILLKDHYGQEPIKGLMARLSRSYNAITHKAHSLGLKAKKEVMKSYV